MVDLDFEYENKPPFALTNYSVNSVDTGNELGLITGSFSIENAVIGGIPAMSMHNVTPSSAEYL